jgi:hypothetical protein
MEKDDKLYVKLMEIHKSTRGIKERKKQSERALKAAMDLSRNGRVSEQAIMAMQYL